MRVLVALALILNIAWADIKCEVTATDANGVVATAEQTCAPEKLYCYTETDASGAKTSGCGLCPNGAGANCEQCVGNDQSSCNKEGAAHGPKCDVTLADGTTVTPLFCSVGVKLCYSEKDANSKTVFGCGQCSGGGTDCEQCVGSDAEPCNKEGVPHGSKCDVTLTDGITVTSASCAQGITVCYSSTGNNGVTTNGCGFCPDPVTVNDGCNQCLGNTNTPCNTDTYKPGAQCEVPNQKKVGLSPVNCPTDTVLCYSPSNAYTGKGPNDWTKYGCGICPETDNDCIQCEGTGCNRAYDAKNFPDPGAEIYCAVTTKTFSRNSLIPITLPARCGAKEGIKYCYGQLVTGTPEYMEYGCGGCSGKESDCQVCLGNNEVPCTPLIKDDEKKDYSHGNVMILNTLLLPLLLALWV